MAYAEAQTVAVETIPVIDIAPLLGDDEASHATVATALRHAAETVGFFYIRNHGIDPELIEQTLEMGRQFYALPADEKATVAINDHHRGHIALGLSRMEGQARTDLKESFVWGQEQRPPGVDAYSPGNPLTGPNQWPAALPGMRETLTQYMDACNALGARLLCAFALALGKPADTFVRQFDRPVSRASILWYPPQAPELGEEQFGVSPHTDFGCLTLLHQDANGGLQVQGKTGAWVNAPPIPGTYVVNVGDLLARWTNDVFASTPHRVINASGAERFSMPVFVDPNEEAVIDPVVAPGATAHYPPVTVGEHILGRINRSFSYRQGA